MKIKKSTNLLLNCLMCSPALTYANDISIYANDINSSANALHSSETMGPPNNFISNIKVHTLEAFSQQGASIYANGYMSAKILVDFTLNSGTVTDIKLKQYRTNDNLPNNWDIGDKVPSVAPDWYYPGSFPHDINSLPYTITNDNGNHNILYVSTNSSANIDICAEITVENEGEEKNYNSCLPENNGNTWDFVQIDAIPARNYSVKNDWEYTMTGQDVTSVNPGSDNDTGKYTHKGYLQTFTPKDFEIRQIFMPQIQDYYSTDSQNLGVVYRVIGRETPNYTNNTIETASLVYVKPNHGIRSLAFDIQDYCPSALEEKFESNCSYNHRATIDTPLIVDTANTINFYQWYSEGNRRTTLGTWSTWGLHKKTSFYVFDTYGNKTEFAAWSQDGQKEFIINGFSPDPQEQ